MILIKTICQFENSNLVDAANVAALAALSTFRRPECSLGGENGQDVIVHPPEVSITEIFGTTVVEYSFASCTIWI